jgi:ABC-type transport system involved in cytochrome c biogenesis permease subunit
MPASPSAAWWRPLASLRLTLVLLTLSLVLIFWGTLAQVTRGLFLATEEFFHSFFVWREIAGVRLPVYPAGYTLGIGLLVNLVAAHAARFTLGWRKGGLLLIHAGLIVLLVGELLTSLLQREAMLRLDEGETKNYAEARREVELVLIDTTEPDRDRVVAVPQDLLRTGARLALPGTPFTAHLREYFPNSELKPRAEAPDAAPTLATTGVGPQIAVFPRPITTKLDERDLITAYVELQTAAGTSLGTWLLSNALAVEQSLTHEGRSYILALRHRRTYLPFEFHLLEFTHDRYPGTQIPKDFSSLLRLHDPAEGAGPEGREVKIYMNNPLRHGGYTFFQSGFDNDDSTTILQVVRNPSWLFPYIACVVVSIGLVWQFGLSLRTARRRSPVVSSTSLPSASAIASRSGLERWLPRLVFALGLLYVGLVAGRALLADGPLDRLGRAPVLLNGRIKPLDTVARSTLLLTHSSQRLAIPEGRLSPMAWLAEVLYRPAIADTREVFLIHDPEVLALAGLSVDRKRFAFNELRPRLGEIEREARLAAKIESQARSPFQRAAVKLNRQLVIYHQLKNSLALEDRPDFGAEIAAFQTALAPGVAAYRAREAGEPHDTDALATLRAYAQRFLDFGARAHFAPIIPEPAKPDESAAWSTYGDALLTSIRAGQLPAAIEAHAAMAAAYQADDLPALADAGARHETLVAASHPRTHLRMRVESAFNAFAPFSVAMVFYVLAFVLVCAGWLLSAPVWHRAALWLLWLTLVVHTAGLLCRMWLEGRPPVTNLYSSAVFIGWGAVLFGAVLERLRGHGFGAATAAILGFGTLIIAHHLSLSGDTLEMMRAVLDTNFWLATHVVVVTLGYSATFLAGFLSLLLVARGLFTRGLTAEESRALGGMIYGTVCFALLFSFVGTVLGGIWADQSWGRFWGWDPKENGALLIVVWNAIILHARWGGLIGLRGLAALALLGNIVTAWSWFGVNMLGIGLHSYGFMDSAFAWLVGFVVLMTFLASVTVLVPATRWRSPVT